MFRFFLTFFYEAQRKPLLRSTQRSMTQCWQRKQNESNFSVCSSFSVKDADIFDLLVSGERNSTCYTRWNHTPTSCVSPRSLQNSPGDVQPACRKWFTFAAQRRWAKRRSTELSNSLFSKTYKWRAPIRLAILCSPIMRIWWASLTLGTILILFSRPFGT